jgi:hypothetical protein
MEARWLLRILVVLSLALPAYAQGPARSIVVTTPRRILISGEQLQLRASARDGNSMLRSADSFDWSTSNPSILSVEPGGIVTARGLGAAMITAGLGGLRTSVTIQVFPSRVDILADRYEITVGDTLPMAAVARDINGEVIPNVPFRWEWTGANGNRTNVAAVSDAGVLRAFGNGLVTVKASIAYTNINAALPSSFIGFTHVTITNRKQFRLTRLLASDPLKPPFRLIPMGYGNEMTINDSGQMVFVADLDGLSSGLVRFVNDRFEILLSTGTPGPKAGSFIQSLQTPSINSRGDVLVRAQTSAGDALFLFNQGQGTPVFMQDSLDGGFQRIRNLTTTRYSLNDTGDILFRADYNIAGSQNLYTGLFKLKGTILELVWSNDDPLPGLPKGYQFNYLGLDRNGAAYFTALSNNGNQGGLYRADGLTAPVRIVGYGDRLSGGNVTYLEAWAFAMSPNGTVAINGQTRDNQTSRGFVVRFRPGDAAPQSLAVDFVQNRPVAVNNSGEVIFVGSPPGRWGAYRWSGSAATPLLLSFTDTGQTMIDGGGLNSFDDFAINARGIVYARVKTTANDMVMVQADTRRVLFGAGTSLNVPANLNFFRFVPGATNGSPYILTGGNQNWSVHEVSPPGLVPQFVTGDRPESGAAGFNMCTVFRGPTGDLYFGGGSSNGSNLYRYSRPRAEAIVRATNGDWVQCDNNNVANGDGMVIYQVAANNTNQLRLFSTYKGRTTILASFRGTDQTPSPGGGFFQGLNWNKSLAVDERGRVMASFNIQNGPPGLFLYENGKWQTAGLFSNMRFDGLSVTALQGIVASGGKFIALFQTPGFGNIIAEYTGDVWTPLIKRGSLLPNGSEINNVNNSFAANSRGDIVAAVQSNGGFAIIMRTVDGESHFLYNIGDVTDAGEMFSSSQVELDIRDDRRVYIMGTTIEDKQVLYLAEPLF